MNLVRSRTKDGQKLDLEKQCITKVGFEVDKTWTLLTKYGQILDEDKVWTNIGFLLDKVWT